MKISEPATVEQERASSRSFSARSFGYACLILMVLASRDALAQTNITVTLQPGETTKTIQAPAAATFMVMYISSETYICNWPTTAQIKTQLELHAGAGSLQSMLDRLESSSGNTAFPFLNIGPKLFVLRGGENLPSLFFSATIVPFTQQQLVAGPLTHTVRTRCVTVNEAETAITQVARVVRAYLGIPQGTLLGAPAPQTQIQGPANQQMQQGPVNPQIQRQMRQ